MPSLDKPLATSPSRASGSGPWLRAELALLVFAALACLAFQLTLPLKEPTDEDYRRVAELLAREARAGDVVFLFPWWTERARLFLPAGLPVVGYLHDEADPLTAYPRIWLLSAPELPRNGNAALARLFMPERVADGALQRFGALTLSRYRNGRSRPKLFSAVEAVARAHVYLEGADGVRTDCAFNGRWHECPGGLRVGAEWHELLFEPRLCLYMRPPGGSTRLVAEFPEVPVASDLLLEGGIIWEHAPKTDVTPLEVGVDEVRTLNSIVTLSVPGGLEGMRHVNASAALGSHALKLWTRSVRPDAREACVDLTSFAATGAAP